jgi:hypothetical protein
MTNIFLKNEVPRCYVCGMGITVAFFEEYNRLENTLLMYRK